MGKVHDMTEGTVQSFIDDAKSVLESLQDEMNDWAESLESASMEHLPKYEQVTECRDQVQSSIDTLNGIDLDDETKGTAAEGLGDAKATAGQDTRKTATSRAARCANACGLLQGAIDAVQEARDAINLEDKANEEGIPFTTAQQEARQELAAIYEEIIEALETAACEAQSAEFPGMFG